MDEKPEHLEYNDGVGDLLREKDTKPFSWVKTFTTMGALLILVGLGLVLAFMAGKVLFSSSVSRHSTAAIAPANEPENESPEVKAPTVPAESPAAAIQPEEKQSQETSHPKKETNVSSEKKGSAKAAEVKKATPKQGEVKVAKKTVEVVPAVKKSVRPALPIVDSAPASPRVFSYKLIYGKYETMQAAKAQVLVLKDKGISAFTWVEKQPSSSMVVVQMGAFDTQEKANAALKAMQKRGIAAQVLQR